jgi:asparagine synthase (glutamine-hydrolysing)
MLRCLEHRGPDSAGWHSANGAGVGQTRLAVIDLETGDPPITNEDGSIGVALNGEIYNFAELRGRLQDAGHDLRTAGDTEVLAHLAEDLDPVALARALDGMYAFAVYDAGRRRLVLGRDRAGKKPLYWWSDGTRLAFASEIKALLAVGVPRRLDPGAIPAFLTFGYVPTPRTFYEGVRSVPPGHVLVLENGGEPRAHRYWTVPCPGANAERLQIGLDEAADGVQTRLRAAVARRLAADVPIGAFLSGGIDSSAIVGLMAECSDQPVRTFTVGFDDPHWYDERPYGRMVARRFRTRHQEFEVRPAAVELIERLIWHHDQPFGDSSAVPTYLLSQLTRQHVTVALAGDGGDELFAGYERFAAAGLVRRYGRAPDPLRRLLAGGLARLPPDSLRGRVRSAQRFSERAGMGLPDAYLAWLSYVPEETRHELLPRPDDWALEDYRRVWAESAGAAPLDRLLDLNFKTYLLDDLLPKVDRMSMGHALEVRSPFLDPELIDFALRLPAEYKARGAALKRVLKRSMRDLLPPPLLRRRKRGFGVPLAHWFRGELSAYVDTTLGGRDARVREHLRGPPLDGLLEEHRAGRRDHGHALWALLTLELWLRREGW